MQYILVIGSDNLDFLNEIKGELNAKKQSGKIDFIYVGKKSFLFGGH